MFNTFGNKVRIKSTPETIEKGLSGKAGVVYGVTTPSMMDLEVIGTPKEDVAINIYFDDLKESFWFDEDLIEHIDNGQGTTISLDGVDKKWTKGKNGEWSEEDTALLVKKWWQFWK